MASSCLDEATKLKEDLEARIESAASRNGDSRWMDHFAYILGTVSHFKLKDLLKAGNVARKSIKDWTDDKEDGDSGEEHVEDDQFSGRMDVLGASETFTDAATIFSASVGARIMSPRTARLFVVGATCTAGGVAISTVGWVAAPAAAPCLKVRIRPSKASSSKMRSDEHLIHR